MKKLSWILVLAMLLSLFGVALAEDAPVTATYGTPVLDGDATDADWEKATPINIGNDSTYGEFRILWDDNACISWQL